MSNKNQRCPWCIGDDSYIVYHDNEWGVPCHDDRTLFEFIVLEGAQAGLAWITVLKKRENYRKALHNFDAARIARYGDDDVARLLADAGIIRNRLKIAATIANARATCTLHEAGHTLDTLLWQCVDGRPVINRWQRMDEVPAYTATAVALSKELKRLGFRFVGPTIVYSLMQAVGLVNDHLVSCPRHAALA
jgi:DNA-3-methyladenine glycosylase I